MSKAARMDRLIARGGCKAPLLDVPPIGSVGPDYKADCTRCGKRVRVTVRGLFAHHKPQLCAGCNDGPCRRPATLLSHDTWVCGECFDNHHCTDGCATPAAPTKENG